MSTALRVSVLACFVALPFAGAARAQTAAPPVPYPEGFREWAHVKSMAIVSPEHPLFGAFGGIHHVYVNETGRAAAERGGAYPDGSVLVFDLLEAKLESGAYVEGPRKLTGVMRKDAQAYTATGGWGFEGFAGDSREERLVNDPRGQCFACHQPQTDADYTFSRWRR
jgi:hypothetical protein